MEEIIDWCHVHVDVSLDFVSHDWHASVHVHTSYFPCSVDIVIVIVVVRVCNVDLTVLGYVQ